MTDPPPDPGPGSASSLEATLDPRLQPTRPLEEPTLDAPSGGEGVSGPSADRRSPLTLRPGDRFATRYEILSTLGRGGFSHVLKARDTTTNDFVALKFLAAEDTRGLMDRMQRELRLARDLRHPNIVRVFDLLEAEGFYCLIMELVEGITLKQSIAETRPLTIGRALELLLAVSSALAAVHAGSIVHRDLKPQNLIVTPGGVKLLDFGLARTPDSTGLTATGTILGTPEYMAPEQVEGKPATARSDLYALGVIAYELLVGDPPFRGDNPLATALQHVRSRVPDPRKARPDCPEDLARLVLRLTDPLPARRPASAQEVLVELSSLARGMGTAGRGRRRAPLLIATAALALLSAVAAFHVRGRSTFADPTADGVLELAVANAPREEILGSTPFLSALQEALNGRLADPRVRVRPVPAGLSAAAFQEPARLVRAGVEELLRLSLRRTEEGRFRVCAELVSPRDGRSRTLPDSRELRGLDFEAIELAARDLAAAYLASVDERLPPAGRAGGSPRSSSAPSLD